MSAGTDSERRFSDLNDEHPVYGESMQPDLRLAQCAVIVHRGQEGPSGSYCIPAGRPPVAVRTIPALRGSVLHMTCVETYRYHRDDRGGLCSSCRQPWPCQPRENAAEVINAVGEDPRQYHDPSSPANAKSAAQSTCADQDRRQPAVQVLSATAIGYSLGGVNRRPVAGNWER